MAQSVAARLLSIVAQIALATILTPADFGSVALAGTVTGIASTIVAFGIDECLLQRGRALIKWSGAALWASVGLSVAAMSLVILAAPFAAALYSAPELQGMLPVMAVAMPIGALGTVPAVVLRSDLRFRTLAGVATTELFVTHALTVVLALWGAGPFSFVWPLPVAAAVRAAALWHFARPRVVRPRQHQVRLLMQRSSAILGERLITIVRNQIDVSVLGVLATKSQAGAYFFALRLSILPIRMLAGSVTSVLMPTLTRLKTSPDRQLQGALHASRILALVVMPYCFLQAALADAGLTLLFGEKWMAAIPMVQLLSIGLAFDAVSWVAGALLSARGQFGLAFRYSCMALPVFAIAVAGGAAARGAFGVAAFVAAFFVVISPVYSYLVFSRGGATFSEVAGIYLRPVSAALIIPLVYVATTFASLGAVEQIVVITTVGGGGYLVLMYLMSPGLFKEARGYVAVAVRGKRLEATS